MTHEEERSWESHALGSHARGGMTAACAKSMMPMHLHNELTFAERSKKSLRVDSAASASIAADSLCHCTRVMNTRESRGHGSDGVSNV